MDIRGDRREKRRKIKKPPSKPPVPDDSISVFDRRLIERLPSAPSSHWLQVLDRKELFDPLHAPAIATGLKRWAASRGATHFIHWFFPCSPLFSQNKDDPFIGNFRLMPIEDLSAQELIRREAPFSSLPSADSISLYRSEGVSLWDPSSFPFLWKGSGGVTLCLPAFFFSSEGDALDSKTPLSRSEEKLESALLRLLSLSGLPGDRVFSMFGFERDYFLIPRPLFLLRPDLVSAGRTLFGTPSSGISHFELPSLSSVKESIQSCMEEVQKEALSLGILFKTSLAPFSPTRLRAVCPSERAPLSADRHFLLLELIRSIAPKYGLACLLDGKPFFNILPSLRKRVWSLSKDEGSNLLDPEESPSFFLILVTAVFRAVCRSLPFGPIPVSPLIDFGEKIRKIVHRLIEEEGKEFNGRKLSADLASLLSEETPSSETEGPFFVRFAPNQFEFQSLADSADPSQEGALINALAADSLHLILDEIESSLGEKGASSDPEAVLKGAFPILRNHWTTLQKTVLFLLDDSDRSKGEAGGKGDSESFLPFSFLSHWTKERASLALRGVFSPKELDLRYRIWIEESVKKMDFEARLMIEIFQTHVLPQAKKDRLERGIGAGLIEQGIASARQIERIQGEIQDMGWEAKGNVYCQLIAPKMEELKQILERLEAIVSDRFWQIPRYRELLFLL